jgi:hypothetical protein
MIRCIRWLVPAACFGVAVALSWMAIPPSLQALRLVQATSGCVCRLQTMDIASSVDWARDAQNVLTKFNISDKSRICSAGEEQDWVNSDASVRRNVKWTAVGTKGTSRRNEGGTTQLDLLLLPLRMFHPPCQPGTPTELTWFSLLSDLSNHAKLRLKADLEKKFKGFVFDVTVSGILQPDNRVSTKVHSTNTCGARASTCDMNVELYSTLQQPKPNQGFVAPPPRVCRATCP